MMTKYFKVSININKVHDFENCQEKKLQKQTIDKIREAERNPKLKGPLDTKPRTESLNILQELIEDIAKEKFEKDYGKLSGKFDSTAASDKENKWLEVLF